MQQTSFLLDEGTAQAIEQLKKEFNVTTNAAVIRRAIALARIATRNSDSDKVVTFLDKDDNSKQIKVALQG